MIVGMAKQSDMFAYIQIEREREREKERMYPYLHEREVKLCDTPSASSNLLVSQVRKEHIFELRRMYKLK